MSATAAWRVLSSGASPPAQRSTLPRIQVAGSSSLQPRHGLGLPGAEHRVVAAEHPAARAGGARIREHRVERAEIAVHVVEDGDHERVYSIGAVTEAAPLTVSGPTLTLRYATPDDAPRLLELGSDPLVTRYFSWGPYTRVEEPLAYIKELAAKRERGEMLEFLIDHREHGPIGVTGLSELSRRDRRATVGSWFGREYWGTGSNLESKALIAALGFETLGMGRLTAWANTRNGRSQVALERVGFRREGVLRALAPPRRRDPRRRRVRPGARRMGAIGAARRARRGSRNGTAVVHRG